MAYPYYTEETLDDLMRSIFEEIYSEGIRINPTKGAATELTGVLLELRNPRARLSRTETRGRTFSCLGELCWYLAGTNSLDFISYYLKGYRKYADDQIIHGGYGPRLINWKEINQLENVINTLKEKPDSRQAVIQLFDSTDIAKKYNDVPCTCTLQFLIREGKLQLITYMRSNDAFWGMPHDIFCFTMLQEVIARDLSVEMGNYKHAVGSLHIYDPFKSKVGRFLKEGWQSTDRCMPEMPIGDPWPQIKKLLDMEAQIRKGRNVCESDLKSIPPYWGDLVRLLQVIRYKKENNPEAIKKTLENLSSDTYESYLRKELDSLI